MKYPFAAIGAMILGMAASLPARAEPMATGMLDRLDANKDGQITREESVAARERMFKRLDANADGTIDAQEVENVREMIKDGAAAAEARLANQWRRMDSDGDGKVSSTEFKSRMVIFDLADRNGDGTITETEIDFMRKLIARRAG